MRILVIASDNPAPPITGSRIRNYHLWSELRKAGHEVKLLCITRDKDDLKNSNSETEYFMFSSKNIFKKIWMRLLHSHHEWPVSDELYARVLQLQKEWKPDIIHAEELRMGRYLPPTGFKSLCVHNVESLLLKQLLGKSLLSKIYHYNLVRFEKRIFKNADILFTYSALDKDQYSKLYPQFKWHVSSNGANVIDLSEQSKQLPEPKKILFLGALSYMPNIEGLFWFLDHVYPSLKDRIELTVAGSKPIEMVKQRLNSMSIKLVDTPLELGPVYGANSMLLVPLLTGSGTRGKILEALMYNRSVLTTSKGVEGLDIQQGQGILVADGVEAYSKELQKWISTDPSECQKLADSGRKVVLEKYTWGKVGDHLIKEWTTSLKR